VGSTLAFGSMVLGSNPSTAYFSHHSASAFSKLRSLARCSLDEVTHLRWDHARTDLYYEHSRVLLQPVLHDLDNIVHLNERHSLLSDVDHVYKRVVDSLVKCAKMFIPKNSIISTNSGGLKN